MDISFLRTSKVLPEVQILFGAISNYDENNILAHKKYQRAYKHKETKSNENKRIFEMG